MKTIKMPAELLAKWLAALRSGEYAQAIGRLQEGGGYCCLGVLQHATTGEVERYSGSAKIAALPSYEWLEDRSISFVGEEGQAEQGPWLPSLNMTAYHANDRGLSFCEIADAIEACAEGV